MRVKKLFYHPLKSGKAVCSDSLTIGRRGPIYDRNWMAVSSGGDFISQRRCPQMALIRSEVRDGQLILNAPGMPELFVPKIPIGEVSQAEIWRTIAQGVEVSSECSDWISHYLGKDARLVVQLPDDKRLIEEPYRVLPESEASFADALPLLLTSQKSLDDLNSRLETPVEMTRFRPNIVIDGVEPFAEESWKQIKIGNHLFYAAKLCARCVMVNVDQDTGEKGSEPLKTLAKYRKMENKIIFGIYLIHSDSCEISVGDPITLIA